MKMLIKKTIKHNQNTIFCPVCGHHVRHINYIYLNGSRVSYFYSCRRCSFIFAKPEMIARLSDRQMDSVSDAEMFHSTLLKRLYTSFILDTEVKKLKKYQLSKTRTMLDVGCGTGWTSHVYSQKGFDVTGVEPSSVRANIAKEKYGLKIINEYVENLPQQNRFNNVVLRHFLEHISDPKSVVLKLKDLIETNGIILIIVPNINSLGRYLFDDKWDWVLPIHCSFFSPKSIRTLLGCSGFDVLESYQTPSPLYFTESLLRKIDNRELTSWFKEHSMAARCLSSICTVFGTAMGLGDNVTVIARKK